MKLLTRKTAGVGLISILSGVIIFHLLVFIGIIPFGIVWGGRLQNETEMLQFEIISISINVTMLITVLLKTGNLNWKVNGSLINGILWVMMILFLLNTVGNIFSTNTLEKAVFTPLTLLLSILTFRLVMK